MKVLRSTGLAAIVLFTSCATQWSRADQQLLDGLKASDAAKVQAALTQGAQPNIEYADGMTPLAVAVARNDHDSAEGLLRAGADPNVAVTVGATGSVLAQSLLSLAEDDQMAKILVKGGADPNRKDQSGETPLGRAVMNGNAGLLKVLLDVGANVESPLADGQRPLWFAVSTGNVAVVDALLGGGADPNREDAKGRTVLHAAAENPTGAVVVALLKGKASPDCHDHNGTTPLMVAAEDGYVGPTRVLLDAGADPNIRNSAGMTALDLANAKDQTQVAELLQEGGGQGTRDAATARVDAATAARAESGADALRVSTAGVLTDGRHLKIRGRVYNPHREAIRGIRYRVSLYGSSKVPQESIIEERRDTEIAAGEAIALRLDVASIYVGSRGGSFFVEAVPMRVGNREIPVPPQWR